MRQFGLRWVLLALAVCLGGHSLWGQYSGGLGTAESPYEISSAEDLIALGANTGDYDKCFVLTADIDLAGFTFTRAVIAWDADIYSMGFQGTRFCGQFDGAGYAIRNLTVDASDQDYVGLFGYNGGGLVCNLELENGTINGHDYTSGLCGLNYGGIKFCYASGSVTGNNEVGSLCGYNSFPGILSQSYATSSVWGNDAVGGLCGINDTELSQSYATGLARGNLRVGGLCGINYGTIKLCYANGSVDGTNDIGGLCGYNSSGTILQSYSCGSVTGSFSVGGLCGSNISARLSQSYALGSVIGSSKVGGLCGYNFRGTLKQCYAIGSISGSIYAGGLCGYQYGGDALLENCFWDVQTTRQTLGYNHDTQYPGTINHVEDLTTIEMQTQTPYINAGWNFGESDGDEANWKMVGPWYPVLEWQDIVLITVPNLTGLTEPQAQIALLGSGFNTGAISESYHKTIPPGQTCSQVPAASTAAPSNYPVSLTFSRGNCYSSGQGTVESPYEINSAKELIILGQNTGDYDKHFILTADIDLAEYTFNRAVIAPDINLLIGYQGMVFTGVLDGAGHAIRNLNINNSDQEFCGLFGAIGYSGQVNNLGLENGNIIGSNNTGGLCGNNSGTLSQSYATGSVSGNWSVGGLCGENYGTFNRIYSSSSVSGIKYIGGLCGKNYGTLIKSYIVGVVSGTDDYVGGLCGYNSYGTFSQSYAAGSVSGNRYVGGLCGINSYGTFSQSYTIGSVRGNSHVGGLCGNNSHGVFSQSYATGSVSGNNSVGGLCGQNNYGAFSLSYSTSPVTGTDGYIGGLCGLNSNSTVSQSYATGSVSGNRYVGGLCGWNYRSTVNQSYATSPVSGTEYVGVLCGLIFSGNLKNSFWDKQITVQLPGYNQDTQVPGVITHVLDLTTAEMMDRAMFINAGWDFTEEDGDPADWKMVRPGEDTPRLSWQEEIVGDIAGLWGVDGVDLMAVADQWQAENPARGDVNGDGAVDLRDVAVLGEHWLEGW